MPKTKTYAGITPTLWRAVKEQSAREHGTRYAPPEGSEGTATTVTPLGDIVLKFVVELPSDSLTYTIVKKPFVVPDDAIWVGVGETIDDCRDAVREAEAKSPHKSALLTVLEQQVATENFEKMWKEHFQDLASAHASSDGRLTSSTLLRLMSKDHEFQNYFESLKGDEAETLERLKRGLVAPHEELPTALRALVKEKSEPLPEVLEANGTPMRCLRRSPFENWGRTVKNTPALTCFPKTKIGICRLVQWAAARGKRVRCGGYRHTWSDLYGQDDHVLISTLPLDVVTTLPAPQPGIDPRNELQGIAIVGEIKEGTETKALCRIGSATTNEQFRRWCLDPHGGNRQWTVPLNVIMVEITWGGSNAHICHGAGWKNETLSDLVAEVEFVNAKGELQIVNDPAALRAAAGCFGLLGVVTSITLKLDRMSYAVMKPESPRLALTIPPPKNFAVPKQVDMSGLSDGDLDAAWTRFVDRCEHHYYAEWFWFPYEERCWINSWRNDGLKEESEDYPNAFHVGLEQAQSFLGQVVNDTLFKLLPGRTQAQLFAHGAMDALPSNRATCTTLIDALHFRRGIQNMRVLDMEVEIPIPARADDPTKPDWSVCQKAWWSAIDLAYRRTDAPMRIALEMRVMGGSNVIMAPQFGNRFGTCAIEVLTTLNTPRAEWQSFMQQLVDEWMKLSDSSGKPLNIRPHWAKQWGGLTMGGMPVVQYLKSKAYRERMPEFKEALSAIARAGDYPLADLKARFSNPLLDDLFEDVFRT